MLTLLKTIIFSALSLSQSRESQVVPFNYFQLLPNEIKEHIASFIEIETDEELLNRLTKNISIGRRYLVNDDVLCIKTVRFEVDICGGNLTFNDQINHNLTHLTKCNSWLNMLDSEYQNRIMRFAISPNKKRIVAIQSLCKMLGNQIWEVRHQRIWAFDRGENGITSRSKYFDFLDERTQEINSPTKDQELFQEGYRDPGFFLGSAKCTLTKFFYHLAISNNGLIGLADSNSVFLLDFETEQLKCLKNFPWLKKLGYRSLINGLEFNPQETKLAVQYTDFNATKNDTKEIVISTGQPEPKYNFYSYFEKRGICKAKQLEQ